MSIFFACLASTLTVDGRKIMLFVWNFGPNEILDYVERCALSFSPKALKCCVGNGFSLDSVTEVRLNENQLTGYPESKKRHAISSEKRKRHRERRREANRVEPTISSSSMNVRMPHIVAPQTPRVDLLAAVASTFRD